MARDALAIDGAAVARIARGATASALCGALAGGALALARGRPALAATYAVSVTANAGAIGGAYATAVEACARARDGARDAATHGAAGALVGGASARARWGRRAMAVGACAGAALAASARATVTAVTTARAGDDARAFPTWSPIQRAGDGEDERALVERAAKARRGELTAREEAATRDAYLRWKMRRADRG